MTTTFPRAHATDTFAATVHYVANDLLANHPDPRVRAALARERIFVYGGSSPEDHHLAAGYGTGASRGGMLVAMHVGTPQQPQREHMIMLYEDGVRAQAQHLGVSLGEQAGETLLHELEHHFGFAPSGHIDATAEEYEATLRAGGTLTPEQWAAYRGQMAQRGAAASPQFGAAFHCPAWCQQ